MAFETGSISMSGINSYLGYIPYDGNYWLNHEWVRSLAGKTTPGTLISFSDLRGKSKEAPLSATGVNDEQTYDSQWGAGTAYAYPSVNPAGSNGSYSYQWSITGSSGLGATLTGANERTCTLYRDFGLGQTGSFYCTLQCIVTSNGQSVTVSNIIGSASWSGNM